MGINADWVGYLKYLGDTGLGQYDLAKIKVIGTSIAAVQKKYRPHLHIERELQWQGPMEDLLPNIGWRTPGLPQDMAV